MSYIGSAFVSFVANPPQVPYGQTNVDIPGPLDRLFIWTMGFGGYYFWLRVDSLSFELAEAPGTFSFDLGDAAPEKERRILIHKYRSDDAYPSSYQTADAAIEIRGRVMDGGTPLAGRTVYFRVVDPPDTASYVVANGHAHDDDNFDPDRGTLSASSATSDANGIVKTTLLSTTFAAGDNYIVEASFDPKIVSDPSYICAAPNCWKSGTFTAWKRVYVEVNKMFRRGRFLTNDVPAGAKEVPLATTSDLTAPTKIRLIHAPPVSENGAFHEEEVFISHFRPKTAFDPPALVLDPARHPNGLKYSYEGPVKAGKELKEPPRIYLADAFGIITGDPAKDYYLPDADLVAPLFESGYVEHVWLTDSMPPATNVPTIAYSGFLPHIATHAGEQDWLTRKWMQHAQRAGIRRSTDPNHQVLFLVRDVDNQETHGDTKVAGGWNDTWLYRKKFGSQTQFAEGVAHELAHSWRVNNVTPLDQYNGGHCNDKLTVKPYDQFGKPGKMCLMTDLVFKLGESGDGEVGFHYVIMGGNAPHSEYLRIRRRSEPIPQNEFPRPDPK